MKDIFVLRSILLLLCFSSTIMAFPVGISLGERFLTSAYYTDDNQLVPIVRIEASDAWKLYITETRDNPKQQGSLAESDVRKLFKTTLHQIKDASEAALGHSVSVLSTIAPQHFSESGGSMAMLRETAVEEGFALRVSQVKYALDGARLAYNLDSCPGFQSEPDVPCDDDDDHYVLVVTYNPNRLSLAMLSVGLYTCKPFNITHYDQYGIGIRDGRGNQASFKGLPTDLHVYIEAFAEEMKKIGVPQALQSLRAIILCGEASSTDLERIKDAIVAALPEHEKKLRLLLDPQFVTAFGSAQRARHIVQNPKFLTPQDPGHQIGEAEDLEGYKDEL